MNFSFTKGQSIRIDDQPYCVNFFNEKGQHQLIGEDGDLIIRSWDELIALYQHGRLSWVRSEQVPGLLPKDRFDPDNIPDLAGFKKAQIEEAGLKHLCIEYVLSKGPWSSTPSVLEPLINEFFLIHGKGRSYRASAMYKAYRRYLASETDWRAQLPTIYKRGNRKRRLSQELNVLVKETFEQLYLNHQQRTISEVYRQLEMKIYQINKLRDPKNKLVTPHKTVLYRLAKKYEKYTLMVKRKGHIEARKEFPSGHRVERPTRPMERVEIDHTVVDIVLVDEVTGLPWGRPTITVAVDYFSGCIVGLYLSAEPPSLNAVLGCLRHTCLPKNNDRPEMEGLDWPCFGIPRTLVCDNASEFHSRGLIHIALDLGIEIPYCGVGQGSQKGKVERTLGMMSKMLFHQLPGTTMSRYEDLGSYDPEKTSSITFQRFVRIVNQWICTDYHQSPNENTAKTPLEIWKGSASSADIRLPRDPALLERLLGSTRSYALRKGPLVIDKISYTSPELGELRRRIGVREHVVVRLFDEDLSYVEVIDPQTKQPFRVFAEDQAYTRGLTRNMHGLVRSKIKAEYKEKAKDESLMEARLAIQNEIESAVQVGKKLRRRQKLAVKATSSLRPQGQPLAPEITPEESRQHYRWRGNEDITSGFATE